MRSRFVSLPLSPVPSASPTASRPSAPPSPSSTSAPSPRPPPLAPSLYLPFPSPDAATPSPPPATELPSLLAPVHRRAALAPSPSPPSLSRPSALRPSPRILRLHCRPRPSNPPSSPTLPVLSSLSFSSPVAPFLASPLPTRGKPDLCRQARHSEEEEAAAMECVFGVVGAFGEPGNRDFSGGDSGSVQFTDYVQKNVHLYKFKNNLPLSTTATALRKALPLPDEPVEIFIGILSSVNHFAQRMGMRKTWMSTVQKSPNVVSHFFVALHGRKEVDMQLKKEA